MSTNKTQNYQLHAWTPEDSFLRTEFNENFAKLDAALAGKSEVVIGSYTGDATNNRTIHLGFRPKAVILATAEGRFFFSNDPSEICGGVFSAASSQPNFKMSANGFVVSHEQTHGGSTNAASSRFSPYTYIAFR